MESLVDSAEALNHLNRESSPPLSHPTRPLGYSTKSELVYRHLREMIVNGRLPPGERLYLQTIAEQLQVSTNPVREAFRRLESEGLIVNRPHTGATVAGVDLEKIETHFLIRAVLEGLAVRLASGHLTEPDLDRLDEFHRRLVDHARIGDFSRWNQLNIEFHRFLFDRSESPDLVAMIDLQRDRSPRFRHFPEALAQRAREADAPRVDLLTALRAGDGETAERIHRTIVARTGQVLCAAMRQSAPGRAANGASSPVGPRASG